MDFVKKAQENPVLVSVGAILAGLGLLAAAWAAFSEQPFFQAVGAAVTVAFNTFAVVAAVIVGGLVISIGALVAVVLGSVRNRNEAKRLSGEVTQLETKVSELDTDLRLTRQREEALKTQLVNTKAEIARDELRRLGSMRFGDGKVRPKVTIRFVGYLNDYELAKTIEKSFRDHTSWEVTLDGSNQPTLEPSGQFKVLFESAMFQSFDGLAHAFATSELLGVTCGRAAADRSDEHHLIVKILPTAQTS